MPSYFLVQNIGNDITNTKKIFANVLQYCTLNNLKEILIVIPMIGHYENYKFNELLGGKIAKQLYKDRSLKINVSSIDITIKITDCAKIKQGKTGACNILLPMWIDPNYIDLYDFISSTNAVFFLPWSSKEGIDWQKEKNATIL